MDCLRIDNSKKLIQKIGLLFNNEELSDIQLYIVSEEENQTLYAHKLILCSNSEVFKIMLTGGNWLENQTNHITLHEEASCIPHFSVFLAYLYSGCICLDHSNVLPHLMLADKYAIEDLQELCKSYMMTNQVCSLDNTHTLAWMEYANVSNHLDLYDSCRKYALYNFERIIESDDFLLANVQTILYFMLQSDLIIHNEFVLFEAIVHYCQQPNNILFDTDSFDLLFNEIRLPFLSPLELNKILNSPNFPTCIIRKIHEKIKDMTAFYEAMSSGINNFSCMGTFSMLYLNPRTYTENNWCTTLNIENFNTLPLHTARSIHFSSPVLSINSQNIAELNKGNTWCPALTNWDWTLELFPKGLTFKPCIMIGIWRNLEVPGADYNSMCLALSTPAKNTERRKVNVAIMITGKQAGIEYISECVQRDWLFDEDKRVQHIRDLLPYHHHHSPSQDTQHVASTNAQQAHTNCVQLCTTYVQNNSQSCEHTNSRTNVISKTSSTFSPTKPAAVLVGPTITTQTNKASCPNHRYLSGSNDDCFKISIVIKPMLS